jgi:uncharacterized phage-like protein YoqJ
MKIIAATGHRPQFCPCEFKEDHEWLIKLKQEITYQLDWYKHEGGIDHIIQGSAIGFDTWFAECALSLGISVHSYIPFRGQGSNWPASSQKKYKEILEKSTVVKYISESYSKSAFLKRDRAMVDDSNYIFSLLNPEIKSGGTYYTVSYAKSLNRPISNFWF